MTRTLKKRPFYGSQSQEIAAYEAPHRAAARKAAGEGIVLLKNEKQTLPLAKGSRIALYGPGATHMIKGGTGSGDVNEREVVNIYQGLLNAGYTVTSRDLIDAYYRIYTDARIAWRDGILERAKEEEFFIAYSTSPFFVPDGPDVEKTDADIAIYVLSRVAGEGADRFNEKGDFYLTDQEAKNIRDICRLYEKVILVINTGGLVDLSFADQYENIGAILYLVQPGMEGGNALADVISGQAVPSGKMTDTWADKYEDYPNAMTFSHMNGNVDQEKYEEGIYVGYRYFDSFQVPVRYSFGFGLSYTDFQIETVKVTAGSEVAAEVKVTNTGKLYSGKEVVQVYVSAPAGKLEKESRRLCGFAKTGLLAPGESETLTIRFPVYRMASYDESSAEWLLERGTYGVWIGNSLADSRMEAMLVLEEEKVLSRVKNICPLREELNLLSIPEEKRIARYEADLESGRGNGAAEIPLDLSGVETEVIDYEAAYEPEDDEAAQIVNGLDTEQLIRLATGEPAKGQGSNLGSAGVSVPGSAGETSTAAYEQGVANIVLADGPAGLRLMQTYGVKDGVIRMPSFEASFEHGFFSQGFQAEGTPYYQYCTAIPVGTMLAQTWNEKLIEETGAMIGKEMEHFGVTLWLAPGMNIHRNPLCGRNFEYYSEDPLVSGKMAAAMTKGVQSVPGCGTTIKHFACNNQEDNRMGSDSILSERALREIYLKGFEIAIRESRPMSIMTSYNLINGIHAANCRDTCTAAARQEWGFDGVIMTDWTTTEHGEDCTASGCMRAGNDLVMPGQFSDHDNMRKELEQGTLKEEDLRRCITRLVRVVLRSGLYETTE
ncbi:glycoside hydrolase family 3 protein [Schaedlerella sp.]|uniref:glycoside hydrolase family 3 protein n=1 Tax=Schaedlerella sp. TaxID=2676057 RepID=UPI0037457A66